MAAKKRPGVDWTKGWRRLREEASTLGKSDSSLFHDMVLTGCGLGADREAIIKNLQWCREPRTPVEQVTVPLGDKSTEEHFFVASSRGLFVAFKEMLRDIDKLLAQVPVAVAPRIPTFPNLDRGTENLIRWLHMLFYLARHLERHTLTTETRCFPSLTPDDALGKPTLFQDTRMLPGFDPWPYVLRIEPAEKSLDLWRLEHEAAGIPFPVLFDFALEKNLCYATANAIDALLLQGMSHVVERPVKSEKRRTRSEQAKQLSSFLWTHHKLDSDSPLLEPLLQTEIAEELKMTQGEISKAITELFGKHGMTQYKRACGRECDLEYLLKERELKDAVKVIQGLDMEVIPRDHRTNRGAQDEYSDDRG